MEGAKGKKSMPKKSELEKSAMSDRSVYSVNILDQTSLEILVVKVKTKLLS